jgi:hypothetical protein
MPTPSPIPECRILFHAETGAYGFECSFPGKRPHYVMDTFISVKNALAWIDSHRERVWEEPSDADETCLLISRSYKPGSVRYANAAGHDSGHPMTEREALNRGDSETLSKKSFKPSSVKILIAFH